MKSIERDTDTAFKMQVPRGDGTREGTRASAILETIKPRLLDAKDAAAYLGISETRVREYVKYGKLRVVTLPHPFRGAKDTRKILIEISELDAFIEKYKAV